MMPRKTLPAEALVDLSRRLATLPTAAMNGACSLRQRRKHMVFLNGPCTGHWQSAGGQRRCVVMSGACRVGCRSTKCGAM